MKINETIIERDTFCVVLNAARHGAILAIRGPDGEASARMLPAEARRLRDALTAMLGDGEPPKG